MAIVAARGGLIGNLKVWENLVLPIAYRGEARLDELEARAESLFRELGVLRGRFAELCALLPDRLSEFERRLAAFVRAMLAEPEIMVYEGLFDGLTRAEIEKATDFDRLFRQHFPFRTAIYVDAEDPMLPALATGYGVGIGTAVNVVTLFTLAYGVFQIVLGPFGDRYGKYRVIGWACTTSAVTALEIGVSDPLAPAE